jgi:hypothetical protein
MGTAEGRFVNRNPLHVINLFEDDRVSATMVDRLRALEDPRLGIFADSVLARNQPFPYRGLQNGLGSAELGRIRRQEFSKLGWRLRRESAPVPVMLYAESAFLRAEAALRGWGPGTAQEWYEEGIRASMQHFGVTDAAAIDAYLARPGVAFAEADTDEARLERIITQKWIALFTDGFEAWAEYRRTGYPRLQPIPTPGETDGAVPSRVLYVQEEYNTNRANVEAAAARIGGDRMTTRVWWDTGRAPRP